MYTKYNTDQFTLIAQNALRNHSVYFEKTCRRDKVKTRTCISCLPDSELHGSLTRKNAFQVYRSSSYILHMGLCTCIKKKKCYHISVRDIHQQFLILAPSPVYTRFRVAALEGRGTPPLRGCAPQDALWCRVVALGSANECLASGHRSASLATVHPHSPGVPSPSVHTPRLFVRALHRILVPAPLPPSDYRPT